MGVKLNKETSDVIHVSQMKDGQIAEVISNGNIIRRIGDIIFALRDLNYYNFANEVNFKVRILKNGETLTITDNE